MKEMAKKTGRGIAWSAVGSMGNQITSFVVFIVLTRLLEPKDFGLLGMATVFTSIIGMFAEQGFEQAIVQRKNLEQGHLDTAFWTSLAIGTVLTMLGILMSRWVASLYDEPQLGPVVAALSITFLFSALKNTQQGYLIREFDFRSLSLRQLLAGIVSGVAGILAAFFGAGVYALVLKVLVNGLIDVVLLWKISTWRPRFRYSWEHLQDLFRFGANMVGVKITNVLRRYSDNLLIGFFLGAAALGYYTVAYRLARLFMDMLDSVIGQVTISTFARLQDDKINLRQVLHKILKMVNLIAFPLFTGLIILAPDLISLFSGARWSTSVPVMRVLSGSGYAITTQIVLSYLMIGLGKMTLLLRINLVNALTYVIAFALTVRSGIFYVGIAYTAVSFIYLGVYLYLTHRMIGFNYWEYFYHLFWSAANCGIMAAAILFFWNLLNEDLGNHLWMKVLLTILLGVTTYSLSVFAFQRTIFLEILNLGVVTFSFKSPNKE